MFILVALCIYSFPDAVLVFHPSLRTTDSTTTYRQIAWVNPTTLLALSHNTQDRIAVFKLDPSTFQIVDRYDVGLGCGVVRLHHNLEVGCVVVEAEDGRVGEGLFFLISFFVLVLAIGRYLMR